MTAHPVLLQRKYTRIIILLSNALSISLGEALDFFMHSITYSLMKDGVGDSHCLSDGYLVEDLIKEYKR